jgi:hypothetical protein
MVNKITDKSSKYSVKSNGDISINITVTLEGLSGAKRKEAVFGAVDSLLDCLNEIQDVISIHPDTIDPRGK